MYTGLGAGLQLSPAFSAFYNESIGNFSYVTDPSMRFSGVWCLAHLLRAVQLMKSAVVARGRTKPRLVLCGWGGDIQLSPLLQGLHTGTKSLGSAGLDIIFSVLNGGGGTEMQPAVLATIKADGREVWVVPWLEYDGALWHPQLHVTGLQAQVAQAAHDHMDGVVALHWRTRNGSDIGWNWDTYAALLTPGGTSTSPTELWTMHVRNRYGPSAVQPLVPLLVDAEANMWLTHLSSEFEPYDTGVGRMTSIQRGKVGTTRDVVGELYRTAANPTHKDSLHALLNTLDFLLQLDNVSAAMAPAAALRTSTTLSATGVPPHDECQTARVAFDGGPYQAMFEAYVGRVRSRGELGVLSAINQKLWRYNLILAKWLNENCGAL